MIYHDPGLRQAANAPVGVPFSWRQGVLVTLEGQQLVGTADLRLEAAQGTGKFYPAGDGAAQIEQRWPIVGNDGEIQPLPVTIRPKPPADWAIEASLWSGGIDGAGMYLLVTFDDVIQALTNHTAYTRVSIRGQSLWAMPHYITEPHKTGCWRRPNAHVAAFGRPAIIAQLHAHDSDTTQSEWLIGFTYSGSRLHDDELRAVRLALDLLGGNRGQLAGEEGFDVNGNRVWHRIYARGRYSSGRHLLFAPGAYTQALFDQFENLAARIHNVMFTNAKPVQIDAIQHQLFTGDETDYPEMALGHYGIALDALTTMAMTQYGPFDRKAMDQKAYNALVAPVLELIVKKFAGYPEARDALVNRARSANDRSVERTRKLFWSEIVRWQLTNEQIELLDLRNPPIHYAHVPSARSLDGLKNVERKSRQFRNILGEAYLRYLGYVGEMNDTANPGQTIEISAGGPSTHT